MVTLDKAGVRLPRSCSETSCILVLNPQLDRPRAARPTSLSLRRGESTTFLVGHFQGGANNLGGLALSVFQCQS